MEKSYLKLTFSCFGELGSTALAHKYFSTSNVGNIFLHYNVTAPCHRLNKIFSTLLPPWSDGHPFPPGRSEFIVNLSLNNSTKLEPAHSDEIQ